MYSIAPWKKSYIVGSTIGSLALGVGMRWRETVVELCEKQPHPSYDRDLMRRCVISSNTLRLMTDLGFTEDNIRRCLKPAKSWKFVTPELFTLKEGSAYAGCAPTEPVYHCREGELLRKMRTEFLRFGGVQLWGTEAGEPYESAEGHGLWEIKRTYGLGAKGLAIISFSNSNRFFPSLLFENSPMRMVGFDVTTGVCHSVNSDVLNVFGKDYDYLIVLGHCTAIHLWMPFEGVVAWRSVKNAGKDDEAKDKETTFHPGLRAMMGESVKVKHDTVWLPATTPTVRNDVNHYSITIMGDALMPVDPFEWRGDRASIAIEESAKLVHSLYSDKIQRGNVAQQFRDQEIDSLIQRASFLKRDFGDAEIFLAANPELPDADDNQQPQLKRVGR